MVKEIIKDTEFLSQKSSTFDSDNDMQVIQDMMDTAIAHKDNCAGLAAVQIGVTKRVILVRHGDKFIPYINPMIIKRSPRTYVTEEGCLSLEGTRSVKRHHSIKVTWTDINGKKQIKEFSGFIAEVIQHEIDHCNGILI